jgi:hypothetical protein
MITLDVPYIFEITSGPRGLMDLFDQYLPGNSLPYPTVQMWKQRQRIPGDWVARVIYVLIRQGINPLTCYVDDEEFGP